MWWKALGSFYTVDQVPVSTCILMASRKEALAYPQDDLDLTDCRYCGFVFNAWFDEKLIEYSGGYEGTQGYSETLAKANRKSYNPFNALQIFRRVLCTLRKACR